MGPNGGCVTARIERVEQRFFAALIGRGADPLLRSLPKKGSWFSVSMDADVLFEGCGPVRGRGGPHGCNSQLGLCEDEAAIGVKYSPSTQTLSVSANAFPMY